MNLTSIKKHFSSWTQPNPTDFSNEFNPQIIESFVMVWLLPLGLLMVSLMNLGVYPENEDTGLWGSAVTVPLANTFVWAIIFWIIVRIVKFFVKKVRVLKK